MSMVFTELIYVGLHKNPEEQETWDGPKTEELLSKLRDHGVLPPLPTKNGPENGEQRSPALPPVTADPGTGRPKSGPRRVSGVNAPAATGNRPTSTLTPAAKASNPESPKPSPEPPAKSPQSPVKSQAIDNKPAVSEKSQSRSCAMLWQKCNDNSAIVTS